MVKCIICGKPITDIPKISEEVKVHSCGTRYYLIPGDECDIIESMMDYLDIIPNKDNDKIILKYKNKTMIAKKIEEGQLYPENIDEFDLSLWIVFII